MVKLMGSLRRAIRWRRGALKEIAAAVGLRPGSLLRWLRVGLPAALSRLEHLLRALGLEPRAWLHRATAPIDIPGLMAELAPEPPPRLVRDLKRAARSLPAAEPIPTSTREEALEIVGAGDLARELRAGDLKMRVHALRQGRRAWGAARALAAVRLLEELRHGSPKEAAPLARVLAVDIAPRLGAAAAEVFCAAAGEVASCHRVMGAHEVAAGILAVALACAEAHDLAPAPLYLRAGTVLRDRLRWTEARAALVEAGVLYYRAGDYVGMAKTLADQGILLYAAWDSTEALPLLRQALAALPGEERIHRLASHFALAGALADLGGRAGAAEALRRAEGLLLPGETHTRGYLLVARGEARRADGDPEGALGLLRQAQACFLKVNALAAANVSLDLLEVLLQLGRQGEAAAAAEALAGLLRPLADQPFAVAAIAQVVRRARVLTQVNIAAAREGLLAPDPERRRPRAGSIWKPPGHGRFRGSGRHLDRQ